MINGASVSGMQGLKNLPIIGSDIEHIVLHLNKKFLVIINKPFRWEEFWFHTPGFIDVVKE